MEVDSENPDKTGDIPVNSRKRRYSSTEATTKQDKNGDVVGGSVHEAPERKSRHLEKFNFLDFSDEVLYEIFQYLDSWTLMALMNTCSRFGSFVLDYRFWSDIDLSKEPLPLGILEDVLERSHPNTTSIKIHGPPITQHLEREGRQFSQTLSKAFLKCCTNLSVLEMKGITIDFRCIRITDFPPTLTRLVLDTCNVRYEGEKSIFFGIESHLTKLEYLGIESNNWFEPYYMMVFSKVPELRTLSLKGCQLLVDFVPYGSMAARFGFKKLESLDMRFTPIKDSDLQCFNAVITLKEILLDCPKALRDVEEPKKKPERCPCSLYPNPEVMCAKGIRNPFPKKFSSKPKEKSNSNSNSSNNNNGGNDEASTSKAAAKKASDEPQSPSQSQSPSSSHSQSNLHSPLQCDDESSLSSSSSSPSASSSSSSNESLPPLLSSSSRDSPKSNQNYPTPGGNAPPFSRFLPRPDQIILLDLSNSWRRALMRGRGNREYRDEQQQQDPEEGQEPQEQREPEEQREPQQQRESQERQEMMEQEESQEPQENERGQQNRQDEQEKVQNLEHPQEEQNKLEEQHPEQQQQEPQQQEQPEQEEQQLEPQQKPEEENQEQQQQQKDEHEQPEQQEQEQEQPQEQPAEQPERPQRPQQQQNNQERNQRQQPPQAQQRPQQPIIIQQIDLIEHQIINNQINNHPENNANQRNNADHINQVLNHPLFWDMINPFGRVGPHMNFEESVEQNRRHHNSNRRCSQYRRQRSRSHNQPISDRGVCCFGRPQNPVEQGIIWIRVGNRPSENSFERLVIRNYKLVTDISLQHLVQCSPFLEYLDLSGTSVTQSGVDQFLRDKPACIVRADHLYEPTAEMKIIDDC